MTYDGRPCEIQGRPVSEPYPPTTEDTVTGPACGNNPSHQLTDGDRQAVDSFRAYLSTLASLRTATHRLDQVRDAVRLHRQQLIGTSELYAVIEAEDVPPADQTADWDALVREADRLCRDGAALQAKAAEIDAQLAALRKQVTEPARGCPPDCPCRAVCVGTLKPAAGARQDGAQPS
ncbi:MAG: hypothetical protein K0R62_6325 [Nonomuraea muscovyensis]|jgi:hypothetical protein|nr:hypothetical protein [Nonomuraea muscovyensis]